jgi:tetrahydromethanopterin S-methyltransferase subunit G
MEAMRNSWTDDRLDDFARHVDHRFDEVDRRFGEVDRRFDEVDRRFGEVNGRLDRIEGRIEAGLDKVDARIDALHHAMNRSIVQVGLMLMVTLALGFLGLILH